MVEPFSVALMCVENTCTYSTLSLLCTIHRKQEGGKRVSNGPTPCVECMNVSGD